MDHRGFTGDPRDIFVNPGGGFVILISPSGAPGFGGIGNFEGPNGFGPDPYGGVGGTNLGSDPFGGPVDPIMGGGYHMGFTDPFGGPIFNAIYNEFGGGFIEAYGDGMTMDAYAESYYFDDPSLYDDYTDNGGGISI